MEIFTLGEKIKIKRKQMNMTLKDLAGDRITPGQISLVESGKSKPSIDLLEYIANKLGTDIDYFLESEEKQASKICKFYVDIAESSLNDNNLLKANDAIESGLQYASKYNLTYYKGKFDIIFGNIKFINKDYEGAQQFCLSANSIFLKLQEVDDAIKSFVFLGIITLNMGYVTTALNYFIQADNIMKEYGDVDEILKAKIFYYTALCYDKVDNTSQSIEYALLAKEKLDVIINRKEYAETLMILSISYAKDNKIKEALKYAEEAKKIFDNLNDKKEISNIETNIGIIFSKSNNMEESFLHLNNALKMKNDSNDTTVFEIMFGLCDNYIKIDDLQSAENIIEETMKKLNDDDHKYRIKCYEYFYKIYNKKNETLKCEQILIDAIKYLEPLNYNKEIADFYILLGKLYDDINEKQLALNYLNKGLEKYKSLGIILNS